MAHEIIIELSAALDAPYIEFPAGKPLIPPIEAIITTEQFLFTFFDLTSWRSNSTGENKFVVNISWNCSGDANLKGTVFILPAHKTSPS